MHDEVLSALGSQAVPHYGPAWAALYHETVANLRTLFGTDGDVYRPDTRLGVRKRTLRCWPSADPSRYTCLAVKAYIAA